MRHRLVLYSRLDCCLCDEMKTLIQQVAERTPLDLEEINIDSSADLKQKYGEEVPVLFINGRKAFKYRLTARQLTARLKSD
ncbi:MAG TPA: glutaredoxin family protein [Candidatus Polarisedimenticolaceae bacterium]|nr:glutaredoxin family protein [Candidatus Polarisedimenticolaceae bacterium]